MVLQEIDWGVRTGILGLKNQSNEIFVCYVWKVFLLNRCMVHIYVRTDHNILLLLQFYFNKNQILSIF